ncbi:MAG TPA: hypothetical protein VHM28_08330, partial [Anaerolineales bacterium]|nr:hypothetical protein [Anaerolineales bacterium]
MKTQRLIIAVLATMFMLACNLPLFVPATQAPATLASATSTFTPLPALPVFTSTPTLVPTPTIPEVTPVSSNVNCRSGPDVAYSAVSYINLSEVAQIAGRNDDSSWWYVRDPHNSGNFCWVSALVVTTLGNLSGLAVIPPPEAIVIKVTVDASVG